MLHFYAERLSTVEINNTFYHMIFLQRNSFFPLYSPQQVRKNSIAAKDPHGRIRHLVILGADQGPDLAFLGGQHHGDHRAPRLLWRARRHPHLYRPGRRDRRPPLQPERQGLHLPVVGHRAVDPAGALGRLRRPLRLQKADRGGHHHQKPGLPDDGHPAHLLAVLGRLPAAGRGHRDLQAARLGHLCQDPDGQDLRGGLGFFLYDYQHRRLSGPAAGAFSLRLLLAHGLLRLRPAGQSESVVAAHLPGS